MCENFSFYSFALVKPIKHHTNEKLIFNDWTAIGGKITNITGTVGNTIVAAQVVFGVFLDYQDYDDYGYTNGYNTVRTAVSFGSAWVGMQVGLRIGSHLGGAIGTLFGGVGAIPGSIIGATVGGLAGAFFGTIAGEEAVDWMYGK